MFSKEFLSSQSTDELHRMRSMAKSLMYRTLYETPHTATSDQMLSIISDVDEELKRRKENGRRNTI